MHIEMTFPNAAKQGMNNTCKPYNYNYIFAIMPCGACMLDHKM